MVQREQLVHIYTRNRFYKISKVARGFTCPLPPLSALHGGFHNRRPEQEVAPIDIDKCVRFEFCQEYSIFKWQNTIFSDEKCFHSNSDGPLHLWRKDGTRYDENHVVLNKQSGRITLNV